MSDNSDVRSLLSVMSGSKHRNEARWQAEGGKTPYRAIESGPEKSATLRVHYSSGDIDLLRYMYMNSISFVSKEDGVAIRYPAGQVDMFGKNLLPLMDAFESETVKRVVAFNPNIHTPPAEGEPLIEEINFWPANAPQAPKQSFKEWLHQLSGSDQQAFLSWLDRSRKQPDQP